MRHRNECREVKEGGLYSEGPLFVWLWVLVVSRMSVGDVCVCVNEDHNRPKKYES